MTHRGVTAFVRDGTTDDWVVREVLDGEYSQLTIRDTDIVADIGANIGIFSIWAAMKGALRVYAYEPDPENYELAVLNVGMNKFPELTHLTNKAVVGNDDHVRPLYLNPGKSKNGRERTGAHSLMEMPGAKSIGVRCININDIFRHIKPTVLKMDIEGGEYECIKAADGFPGIREMILEFHHEMLGLDEFKEILDILSGYFEIIRIKSRDRLSIIYARKYTEEVSG